MTAETSHGRGGAGNINTDDTQYGDGGLVRVGVEGSHGDGAYSAGRGGAGNIADAGIPATERKDEVVAPEPAIRPSQDEDFHVGRGGAGNAHTAAEHEKKKAAEGGNISFADKLKGKIFGKFSKK